MSEGTRLEGRGRDREGRDGTAGRGQSESNLCRHEHYPNDNEARIFCGSDKEIKRAQSEEKKEVII